MDLVFRRVNGLELDKCMEIAHDLREWFNEQGLRKIVVDIREYETYGAYLNGELVGFAVLRFKHDFAEIMWMAVKRKYQGVGIWNQTIKLYRGSSQGSRHQINYRKKSAETQTTNPM